MAPGMADVTMQLLARRRGLAKPHYEMAERSTESMSLEERIEDLQSRTDFFDGHERRKTAALLLVGCMCGLIGYVFALIIGIAKFLLGSPGVPFIGGAGKVCFSADGQPVLCPSTLGYFPPYISELCSDQLDPAGKIFWAFELISSIMIFMSWYPWELRTVYLGDDTTVLGVSWTMWRQYLPATGLMIIACVPTPPLAQADVLDWICICVHFSGLLMHFIGYVAVETYTMWWAFGQGKASMHRFEVATRTALLYTIFAEYCLFAFLMMLVVLPELFPEYTLAYEPCCRDVWEVISDSKTGKPLFNGKRQLTNTATGWFLVIKMLCFAVQIAAGAALFKSMFAIWWYCDERQVELKERAEVPIDRFPPELKEKARSARL